MEYSFNEAELAEIRRHVSKYPDRHSAIMPALWIAQEKFGWLSKEAMELVASTLDVPYARVYGVATFYTMYFKKQVPKYLFDVCTCFTCGECGGKQVYEHAKKYLNADENGYSADGMFWVREAECLGACDTAPVMQVANKHYVHHLTNERIEQVIEEMRRGTLPQYNRIPLNDQSRIDA